MGILELEPVPVPKFWEPVESVSVPIPKIKEPVWPVPVPILNFRGGYLEPLTPSFKSLFKGSFNYLTNCNYFQLLLTVKY